MGYPRHNPDKPGQIKENVARSLLNSLNATFANAE